MKQSLSEWIRNIKMMQCFNTITYKDMDENFGLLMQNSEESKCNKGNLTHNFKHLFLCIQGNCLYPYIAVLPFHNILVLNYHTKTHALQFYSVLLLTVLNRQVNS